MDPVNILLGLSLIVSLGANYSGAKKGFKVAISNVVLRPKTYLQQVPPTVSTIVLLLVIIGIFQIGTLKIEQGSPLYWTKIAGLIVFISFSFLQVKSFKSLGKSYSQDIVIVKNQELHTSGMYKFIRHPQYICQILSDLGAAAAVVSYLAVPVVLILEIPLFILRAKEEEKILEKHFKEDYTKYKKRSGFFIPFLG